MKKIKEKIKDQFETECWCYREIADPYQVVEGLATLPVFQRFCNPYKAFRKFFTYKKLTEWLHNWEELVESALSKNCGGLGLEMTEVYSWLMKLIEAGHLINVREVNHIDGRLKNRFLDS